MLTPEVQVEILRLYFAGKLSRRQIAKQLDVDRKTVAAVIARRRVLLSAAPLIPRSTCPRRPAPIHPRPSLPIDRSVAR